MPLEAIKLSDDCRPFAFECITRTGWSQRVALCLPVDDCAMNRRTVLTELDADHEALKPEFRESILFDLGLGALQADLCVRIDNTDVVFWYTFGHTHIPRPEDYPVMPTAYIGFLLKPNGFFDLNPANDVPPSTKPAPNKTCCH